jgi:hypothetical protein
MVIGKIFEKHLDHCLALEAKLNQVLTFAMMPDGTEKKFDPENPEHTRMFYNEVKKVWSENPSGFNKLVWGVGEKLK